MKTLSHADFRSVRKEVDKQFVKQFGRNLRKIRKRQGLTLEQLANDSDIEYSQISRIERGLINTTISTVKTIADALVVPVRDLFDFDSSSP